MQSTIAIFKYLYEHLPPLFPAEIADKMKHALDHLEHDSSVTLHEIEKTMIVFGYEVWPWNEAYSEFLNIAEGKVGEHFLLPKFSKKMKEKYEDFMHSGGTWRDLHSGRAVAFFKTDERSELCAAFLEAGKELHAFVDREIVGLEKEKYLRQVNSFKNILGEIKKRLDDMRALADKEQDHPTLAGEIRERVKMFEHSLCLLAPALDYEAVCQSVDFFHGRKKDLNCMRGINVPTEVDFFNDK